MCDMVIRVPIIESHRHPSRVIKFLVLLLFSSLIFTDGERDTEGGDRFKQEETVTSVSFSCTKMPEFVSIGRFLL